MRLSTLFLLTTAGVANAGVVTIESASFGSGADVTNATPGVTLQELTNYGLPAGYALNPVYIVPNYTPMEAGPTFFGHNNGNPLIIRHDFRNASWWVDNCFRLRTCYNGTAEHINVLLMSFQYPTDLVELRVHVTEADSDWSWLRLYDSRKQLLATCYVPGGTSLHFPHYVPAKDPRFPVPCGELLRAYECSSGGMWCHAEYRVRVTRSYPDIAYAIWGGEAFNSTRSAVNRISFRRFGDCAP